MFKRSPGGPPKLSPNTSSFFRARQKALTKHDVTTSTSLPHWRRLYSEYIPELREKGATPEEFTDDDLVRFLAETNGDVRPWDAKGKLAKEFRATKLPIPRADVLRSMKTGKFVWIGHDKVGRAVCYYRVKLHNPKEFTPEETLKHVIYEYEEMLARDKPATDEVCVVIDRTDAKSSNMDIEFMKLIYSAFKDYYPGRGELFLVLGVNWAFKAIWNSVIVHFLDCKSRSSTYLLKNKAELEDFIDEDEMPDFIGGKVPYKFNPPADA